MESYTAACQSRESRKVENRGERIGHGINNVRQVVEKMGQQMDKLRQSGPEITSNHCNMELRNRISFRGMTHRTGWHRIGWYKDSNVCRRYVSRGMCK